MDSVASKSQINQHLAERQGFEPWKELPPCWFSRPVHSTALPSLRRAWFNDARDNDEVDITFGGVTQPYRAVLLEVRIMMP